MLSRNMVSFTPILDILPPAQRKLWEQLHATPEHFTLYGGTALALYLGHRQSIDFDFFSRKDFEPDALMRSIPYLAGAERLDVARNTLTCNVRRDGNVKVQFFGGLSLGQVEPRIQPTGSGVWVASLLDVAGTKIKVIPERSAEKDYLDIDALLNHGINLPTMLGAATAIYGRSFNAVLSLKALAYFDDVPNLSDDIKKRLTKASLAIELAKIPVFKSTQAAKPGNARETI